MSKQNNMGTYTLVPGGGPAGSNSYTIVSADGVSVVALKLSAGGAATVSGSAKIGQFGVSSPLALVAEEPTVFSNDELIDGLVITVTSGSVLVITNQ